MRLLHAAGVPLAERGSRCQLNNLSSPPQTERSFCLSTRAAISLSLLSLFYFYCFDSIRHSTTFFLYLFKSGHDDINLFFLPALSLSRPAFHQDVLTGQVGCKSKNIRTSFSKKQLCSAGMASEIIIPSPPLQERTTGSSSLKTSHQKEKQRKKEPFLLIF